MNKRAAYLDTRIDQERDWRLRDAVRALVAHVFEVRGSDIRHGDGAREAYARTALVALLSEAGGMRMAEIAELCEFSTAVVEHELARFAALHRRNQVFTIPYKRVESALAELKIRRRA